VVPTAINLCAFILTLQETIPPLFASVELNGVLPREEKGAYNEALPAATRSKPKTAFEADAATSSIPIPVAAVVYDIAFGVVDVPPVYVTRAPATGAVVAVAP